MTTSQSPEPWLRGTLTDVPPVARAVLHALEGAREDIERWCSGLADHQLDARPAGIAPVAFHIRHIAGSIDRLLTYAEGHPLNADQIASLKAELDPLASGPRLFADFRSALEKSGARIRAFDASQLNEPRTVGTRQLPTTLAGLLLHVADHTQRHVGQAITTAKIVAAQEK